MGNATTLAIANAAGSAGKTTTAVSIAEVAARTGLDVIVVDLDPQATATWWLGVDVADEQTTTGDVLLRRATAADTLVDTVVNRVRLLPAARSMDADAVELQHAVAGPEQRLRLALRSVTADLIIIDCPGTIGTVTLSALVAATHVLAVTQPTLKELEGLPHLEAVVQDVNETFDRAIGFAGVVPCLVPPASAGKAYRDALRLLISEYSDRVAPPVSRSVKVPEAHAQRLPVTRHAPRSQVAEDYRQVTAWLTRRGVI